MTLHDIIDQAIKGCEKDNIPFGRPKFLEKFRESFSVYCMHYGESYHNDLSDIDYLFDQNDLYLVLRFKNSTGSRTIKYRVRMMITSEEFVDSLREIARS